jgi:NitT/TauT family transport system substrate-binding protein
MALVASALLISSCFSACSRADNKPAVPPEKVTIAYSATTDAVLPEIAQSRGYYREEGLEVVPHLHPYGKPALKEVLEGKADFATVAETPVMFAIMNGEKISIIATIQTSNKDNAIVARKDKGIRTLRDLKGKRIGATLGTTSDFFLDAILGVHRISRKDVDVLDLKAEAMPDALEHGDVDAIATFNPYLIQAQRRLGARGITFLDEDIYTWTFNVVATQEFIRNNPGKVSKVLRSLVKAEKFVREYPSEAQKIVADFSGIDMGIVRDIWDTTTYSVTLDQSLVLAMEDETRWALKDRLIAEKEVPNFLDFIYLDGLTSVKPDAVRILR